MDKKTHGFGDVLQALDMGHKAHRLAWESAKVVKLGIKIKKEDDIIMQETNRLDYVWSPVQTDILAKDWVIDYAFKDNKDPQGQDKE